MVTSLSLYLKVHVRKNLVYLPEANHAGITNKRKTIKKKIYLLRLAKHGLKFQSLSKLSYDVYILMLPVFVFYCVSDAWVNISHIKTS